MSKTFLVKQLEELTKTLENATYNSTYYGIGNCIKKNHR